ncbi:formamidopyrimidine-DNA glycosylase [Candidatus Beckwithbacteria bacterium CG10_big_fil_rev_8_21_14_0_10_34_10]|uniref:Formamidopyrimidine-DNA glycosylase n=1 Tax=Candidatus Beckwithbacteria bacterium CG10_big_fil_rev_8_21_14_0_10_34_10 TaxID=1974495 RepID=A0A2H0W7Z6_9BACT|nr:MAG: formamidopyrimidine-DNA glycosylase [Candidatus Beckwithbacteria bacterium CG10_big_fil_rev_8_21_14_0_10_34_10]
MPELPEVETIKNSLEKKIKGNIISSIEVLKKKSFRGNQNKVWGLEILSLGRRGKNLYFKLEKENNLLIHLKMTGQLIYQTKNKIEDLKHQRVVINFNDKSRLVFNDLRIFGWIKLFNNKDLEKEFTILGPEPFFKEFNDGYLKKILTRSRRAIKLSLLDQKKISGIGNIYANEALYQAKILPIRPSNSLTDKEIKKLRLGIIKVLRKGIKYKGSTAADENYRLPDGSKGQYQTHFKVYQKNGKKCHQCKKLIKKIKLGGRGTFYCPVCQK